MKCIHWQRAAFAKLLEALVFFLLIRATVRVVLAQAADPAPACPGLKIEIRVPDDIVRPRSNVLLEMKLTNVGPVETFLPSGSPGIWSYEVDLRDALGTPVPRTSEWMRAISERPTNVTLNVPLPLAAGASLTKTVILDKLFDLRGEMRQAPREPDPNWSFSRFRDTASTLEIPPGKSAEQTVLLGDVFDVSKPGNYRAKVSLVDPLSNRLIDSNTVAFEIEDQASSSSLPKQPPFIVTLRSEYFLPPDPGNVLICMSNISDHDIPLDNSALKDFASVEASDGTAAAMNETALKDWKPENLKRAPAASVQSNTWDFAVKPRKALCGGLEVGVIYDLSRPGAYRVRIDRYDEPDAMMGQKLGELPLVHSNWLTIFEPFPASSGNK